MPFSIKSAILYIVDIVQHLAYDKERVARVIKLTLSMTLFFCILAGILASTSSLLAEDVSLPPLPVTGYDFTDMGNDVYGEYDLTLYKDADIIYDPQRGPVLQLAGTGYA